jgi:hypothetical protein
MQRNYYPSYIYKSYYSGQYDEYDGNGINNDNDNDENNDIFELPINNNNDLDIYDIDPHSHDEIISPIFVNDFQYHYMIPNQWNVNPYQPVISSDDYMNYDGDDGDETEEVSDSDY